MKKAAADLNHFYMCPTLNYRKVDLASKDRSSIVSFALSDEPVSLEITHYPDKEKVSVSSLFFEGLFRVNFWFQFIL